MLTRALRFEVKSVGEEGAVFSGHAACFGNVDRAGDICVPGCFAKNLPDFLKDGLVVWQHDWSLPIGKPLHAEEDAKGLAFSATLSDTTHGRDARTLMRDGVVRKMSIGYDVRDCEPLTADNIEEYCDPRSVSMRDLEAALLWGRALKEIYLYEISPVSVPANNLAEITGIKGASPEETPLDDQLTRLLAASHDIIARCKSAADVRRAEETLLADIARPRMRQLEAALASLSEELSGLLAPLPEGRKLYARFLATEARLNGVGV